MFGYDEGIILSFYVGEVIASTLGLNEGADLDSLDGSLMVSMMPHLRVRCLRTHLDHTM